MGIFSKFKGKVTELNKALEDDMKKDISTAGKMLGVIDKNTIFHSFNELLQENKYKLKIINDIETVFQEYRSIDKNLILEQEFLYFKDELIIPVLDKNNQKCIVVNDLFKKINESYMEKFLDHEIILINKSDSVRTIYSLLFENIEIKKEEEHNSNYYLNKIVTKAAILRASDIHFTWASNYVIVRYRIDGTFLQENWDVIDHELANSIRISIINLCEEDEFSLKSIDGKFNYKVMDLIKEYRVSIGHTVFGYSIVIRSLPELNKDLSLEKLGYTQKAIDMIQKIVAHEYGLFLITGPTGSGKTTTLYTHLMERYNQEPCIIKTIEDPVEIHFEGIDQYQVNTKGEKEYQQTYLSAIKMFLRQDPDVILLGEIRDTEVALEAFKAALTGHFVLSTLHTSNVESSIIRLNDLGIFKDKIEDGLVGILNQILIPKLCTCKIKNHDTKTYDRNKDGCSICRLNKVPGYNGRTVIAEIARLDLKINNFKKENFREHYTRQENLDELLANGTIDLSLYNQYIHMDNEE